MNFHSEWITTHEFAPLLPINIFHKEHDEIVIPESPIKNNHVHFRKKIFIGAHKQVTINISADDYYKLYINGVFVAQGPASAYAASYNYNHLDITSYLQEGENIIAVHVYYHGEITRAYDSGDNRQGMIADLFIDGVYHIAKEYSGVLTGPHKTQYLENIDFRKKEYGWKNLNFPEEEYQAAIENRKDDHIFTDEPAKCVSVYYLPPQKVIPIGKGQWFIDFGTELTGQFYMKMKGLPGQSVRILCGEELLDGSPYDVRYEMRCNTNYDETCILSGQEDEFEFFDYKAFRFVNIISEYDNLNPDTFCASNSPGCTSSPSTSTFQPGS